MYPTPFLWNWNLKTNLNLLDCVLYNGPKKAVEQTYMMLLKAFSYLQFCMQKWGKNVYRDIVVWVDLAWSDG